MKWLFQLKNTSSRRDKLLQTVDVMVYFTLFFFLFFFKAIITQLIASRKFLMWCSNLFSFFFSFFCRWRRHWGQPELLLFGSEGGGAEEQLTCSTLQPADRDLQDGVRLPPWWTCLSKVGWWLEGSTVTADMPSSRAQSSKFNSRSAVMWTPSVALLCTRITDWLQGAFQNRG